MRVLIYGAGVIGCELAHSLLRAGNDVTLLARGEWKRTLTESGLIIRHWAQLRTTVDHPMVIGELLPQDCYDLIFVVMQYTHISAVLPILTANHSRRVVLVGNNPQAEDALRALTDCAYPKEVAFGFQGTGGRRENGRVVSIHTGKVGMTIGALNGHVSTAFRDMLEQTANGVLRFTWETYMDAWLKCHLAFVLPICAVCYMLDGHLPRAQKVHLHMMIQATVEAHRALKKLGYPIRPDGEEAFFTTQLKRCYGTLWLMAKTPVGRLAVSDHAMRAKDEMRALDAAMEKLLETAQVEMPAWEALRDLAGFSDKEQVAGVFGMLKGGKTMDEAVHTFPKKEKK